MKPCMCISLWKMLMSVWFLIMKNRTTFALGHSRLQFLAVTRLCDLGPNDNVCAVQWTREGSYVSVGTSNGLVQVWDGTQCKRVRSMSGHQTRVGVLSCNSRILASGSRDRNILQHDLRVSTDYINKLVGHKSEIQRRIRTGPLEKRRNCSVHLKRIHILLVQTTYSWYCIFTLTYTPLALAIG